MDVFLIVLIFIISPIAVAVSIGAATMFFFGWHWLVIPILIILAATIGLIIGAKYFSHQ